MVPSNPSPHLHNRTRRHDRDRCNSTAQEATPELLSAYFARNSRRVYSLCLRMGEEQSEAEDLTQEASCNYFEDFILRGESTSRRGCIEYPSMSC